MGAFYSVGNMSKRFYDKQFKILIYCFILNKATPACFNELSYRKHLQYTSICERSEVLSDTLMAIVTVVITSVIIATFHICNSVKHSVYGNNDQFQ